MDLLQLIFHNFFSFVLIISFIVFVHEFGHFWVARLCGVKVETFAIGFGKELFGFNDKKGTRWKFCLLPFGGYVKMFGDRNAASAPDSAAIAAMSLSEKKSSFVGKNVYQRIAIAAAGPIANVLLTIVLLAILFRINGLTKVLPIASEVMKNSAAYEAGVKVGDKILAIDGVAVATFDDIRQLVVEPSKNDLKFLIERQVKKKTQQIEIVVTPKIESRKDVFGDEVKLRTVGIAASQFDHRELNMVQSFEQSVKETGRLSVELFKALGQLITGKRDLRELGGPVKIAKYSGKSVSAGLLMVLWFSAMISLNLGLMNILPIPVLDGGHIFFYLIEAVIGKPLPLQVQERCFRVGMILVLSLMAFTTFNDIYSIFSK